MNFQISNYCAVYTLCNLDSFHASPSFRTSNPRIQDEEVVSIFSSLQLSYPLMQVQKNLLWKIILKTKAFAPATETVKIHTYFKSDRGYFSENTHLFVIESEKR
ncbi:unnamed protein product [Sphenostylis stenocarpa]|uniref:Uncharacterized protein n=1 Tax=Sphenostylis stenocarpa TaxID=92480 RepID=A0AA86SEK6_9FABA|nr:unnamed protein product [Sphenostylis stenocarpa]